jgi:hypothetical protein
MCLKDKILPKSKRWDMIYFKVGSLRKLFVLEAYFNCNLKVSIRKLFLKRETEKRVSMSDKLSSILKLIVQNNFNIVFILHLGKHLISFFMFLLHSTNFSSIERFHFFHFTSIIKMLSTVKKFRIIVPFET